MRCIRKFYIKKLKHLSYAGVSSGGGVNGAVAPLNIFFHITIITSNF